MKQIRLLPVATGVFCIPGVVLRALHLLNGFDMDQGLPVAGSRWLLYISALLVVSAVLYGVLALPLRKQQKTPFEQLLGTKAPLFRMMAVISGLLLIAGGACYLYAAVTVQEEEPMLWARVLELVYAGVTIVTGACCIGLAKAQGSEMTETTAKLTLPPLLWSCLHLLVNYRMTCVDPKLPSFAFGLVADILLVIAFYQLARLLYGKPQPAGLALFSALAITSAVSDLGGYGLAWLMGARAADWSFKMVVRGGLGVAACVLLMAQLCVLCRNRQQTPGYRTETE